jgi:hypothetical protein
LAGKSILTFRSRLDFKVLVGVFTGACEPKRFGCSEGYFKSNTIDCGFQIKSRAKNTAYCAVSLEHRILWCVSILVMASKSENNSVLDGERPQKSASASKKSRRSRLKKSSSKQTSSRLFDIEAVGLVLLGLAILLSCAVFLPVKMNPMAGLNKSLFGTLGVGMYLTPLPFAMYGIVSMAKAKFKSSTRVLIGVLVLATAALFVTALYRPELAGVLSSIARPLRPVVGHFAGGSGCQFRGGNHLQP